MVGGTVDTNTLKFGQSSKGKLEEIAEELRKSVEHSEKLTAQLKALRLELQQVESRMRELSGSESNNEIKISGLEATLKDLKGRMAKGREEATTKAKESEELRQAIERLSKEVASAASKVEQTKSQREQARQKADGDRPQGPHHQAARVAIRGGGAHRLGGGAELGEGHRQDPDGPAP